MRELVVVLSSGYEGPSGGLTGLRRRMFRLLDGLEDQVLFGPPRGA